MMNHNMSFQERAKLAMEMLSKQRIFTLEEKRMQALSVKISSTKGNIKQEIQYTLKIYHPDWTQEQIDKEYQRVMMLYKK